MTSTEWWKRALLLSFLALAPAGVPRVARAQQPQHSAADIAQARQLFNQGEDLRNNGDTKGALEKFKAAHALAGTPITGVELGRTYMQLGQLVEAHETFLSIARIPVLKEETPRSTAARKEAAQLADLVAPRIPSVSITITGGPPDQVSVSIDGVPVPAAALTSPRLLDPGPHTIVATVGGARGESSVQLKEGETKPVELKLAPAPAASQGSTQETPAGSSSPAAAEAPPPVRGGLGPLVYVGGGVAVVGLGVGAVTGLMAMSKASSVKDACNGTTCPRSVDGDLSSGRTLGNVSTIAFVVGGAGLATLIVGLVLHNRHGSESTAQTAWVTPWVGVASAGVSGAF
jgi:hypothetical protein